jgi:hypothetical protein
MANDTVNGLCCSADVLSSPMCKRILPNHPMAMEPVTMKEGPMLRQYTRVAPSI